MITWIELEVEEAPPSLVRLLIKDVQGNHWITMRLDEDVYFGNEGQCQVHIVDKNVDKYVELTNE